MSPGLAFPGDPAPSGSRRSESGSAPHAKRARGPSEMGGRAVRSFAKSSRSWPGPGAVGWHRRSGIFASLLSTTARAHCCAGLGKPGSRAASRLALTRLRHCRKVACRPRTAGRAAWRCPRVGPEAMASRGDGAGRSVRARWAPGGGSARTGDGRTRFGQQVPEPVGPEDPRSPRKVGGGPRRRGCAAEALAIGHVAGYADRPGRRRRGRLPTRGRPGRLLLPQKKTKKT